MSLARGFRPLRTAFGWRRGMAYVVLWTLFVGSLENIVPVSSFAPDEVYALVLAGVPGHLFAAILFVVLAALAVPRLPAAWLVLATVAVAMLITTIRSLAPDPFVSFENTTLSQSQESRLRTSVVYLGWGLLIYGGLFVCAIALAHRAERTQALLGRSEIARIRSETLFSRAQAMGLQGCVDPAFLLRVLDEMQQRYAVDVASADRLLDRLVAFLRLAMPGVRSGHSTLGAEVLAARSYARLVAELDPGRGAWHCDIDSVLTDMSFPPLLLLPLLDRLGAQQPAGLPLRMKAKSGSSQATLTLHGRAGPGWLGDDLLYRLRVGLRTVHAGASVAVAEPGAADALTIVLPLGSSLSNGSAGSDSHFNDAGEPSWTRPGLKTN
jgi:hypothetical protein